MCKSCYGKWRLSQPGKKKKANRRSLEWQKKNPERHLAAKRKWLYGVSDEDVKRMEREQDGRCAICGESAPLHVDHCHESNTVRGLLCGNCNRGLGCFKDNVEILSRAIDYLR